jgi:UDP-glucose:(glucosyl)LPS alpha-1,2-glucosyltransferase
MVILSNNVEIKNKNVFQYNKHVFGGTEYMAKNVVSNILPDLANFENYNCVLIPGPFFESSDQETIVWLHNYPFEFNNDMPVGPNGSETINGQEKIIEVLKSKKTKYVIAVSETQKKYLKETLEIPEEKLVVIPNAIYPLKFNKDKFKNVDKIKLIFASSPDRGLINLLLAMRHVKDQNVELSVFSDFPIDLIEEDGLKELADDSRITFYGKSPHKTVHKYFEESHIFAYPSLHTETFCLSQAEALSSGCLAIYNNVNLAAISEISGGFGNEVSFKLESAEEDSLIFADAINKGIEQIRAGKFNPGKQVSYINEKYSWEKAKENWKALHEKLSQ